MKVLHFNRDHSAWRGGDAIQIENTIKALNRLDVESIYSCDPGIDLSLFDIVHIYHLTFAWGISMALRCKEERKPYVVSAIFYPISNNILAEIVNDSVATIALSQAEKQEMVDILGCNAEQIIVIPNGVDKNIFHPANDITRIDGLVNIGRMLCSKGILLLAESCKRLGLKFIHIGQSYGNEYSQQCLSLIDQHFDYIPQNEIAGILRRARLYVCPSLSERMSLGVLEAAACGLPIVDSIFHRGADLLPSSMVVDPNDPEALDNAILKQYDQPQNTDYVPSWDDVSTQIKSIYKGVNLE